MTSADDNNGTLLLSASVLPGRNNSQKPIEKLPALYAGLNQPPAADGTGKHRHFMMIVTMMRYAFT
jgi:hypothetical protein